ncbi:cell division protein [Lactobacillus johnsonii]|uniref:Cell division protein n=1 Tax=Lactobacillus johnsonii TaxID=33959 RepID=A0AAX0PXF0_LACJH|nr:MULTISPECIES: 6-pyruvoyl-tetrahydropterin synthase-related protein [Lactobacillus]ARW75109.1 cell division protein [Lactobacillus johnsonii]ARW76931.1 cell division protein [Lactobacillus johnsonii]PAB46277.1 cell division protein [Lactobacillus johnsonii]PAB53584.1 cell division protein [Lactobacillus johnsonii]PEG77005.1 cell division protein [Lactobacillus sp. UMNPBX19]
MKNHSVEKYKNKIIDYLIPIILSLVIATVLIWTELTTRSGLTLDDTAFHFHRFYDTYQQIQNHNFSYFQMNYGMGESGRIVNALYGPFFAYLMGSLLLFCSSWLRFQILITYLIFLVGGLGIYRLSRKVKISQVVSSIVTALFLTTGYIAYWPRSNAFNSWGAVLIPFVLIQGINLLNNHKTRFSWISLGIVMAIVAQIHLLSTFFSILALIPFFIYGLVLSENKRQMWIDVFKAVGLFIVLTANVWGAFLLLYPTNQMASPIDYSPVLTAVNLSVAGTSTMWASITEVTLLLFIVQLIYVIFNFKSSKLNTFVTLEGIVFLYLSSNLFPWQFVKDTLPAVTGYLQFPNRFTVVAYPLLFLGIGLTLNELIKRHGKKLGMIASALAIVVVLFNVRADFNEINNNITYNKGITSNAKEMKEKGLAPYINKVEINSPDYLPVRKKIKSSDITGMLMSMSPQKNNFEQKALSNGRLELTWKDSTSKVTTLPIFIYKQSELSLNNKVIKPKVNEIGMPQVQSRKGKNTAILSFKTPIWFTILLYISILSWVLLIIYGVFRWVKIIKK